MKETPAFKDTAEYVQFAKQHGVFGAQAIALKKKMDKLYKIPEPKILK